MKLSYDLIVIEANRLYEKAVAETDPDKQLFYQKLYREYLDAVGWDEASFEAEMAKRVDSDWEGSSRPSQDKSN